MAGSNQVAASRRILPENRAVSGELLKLGIAMAQSTVAKSWRTILTNHVEQTDSIDFFTMPTVTFRVLFCLRRAVAFGAE